jgi:hypothetical protein
VVCGRNAIADLGVANGTRGTITALDVERRTLTIRTDGKDPNEVALPGWYLDGRGQGEHNRRVDLAYATTGHRAQGLTRWRALVRLTGTEDVNWLYVQLSRAQQETRLYAVVGPEPHGAGELDLPDRDAPDGYVQLAQALSRPGEQRLAIDTPSTLDLRRLSTAELRAERDRLRAELDRCPRDRQRELERAAVRRAQADQTLSELRNPGQRPPGGMLRLLRLGQQPNPGDRGALAVVTQQADRATDTELKLRSYQQRRAGWLEANAHLGPAYRQLLRELAWQRRATGLAHEALQHDQPESVRELLGRVPASTRGRRAWRQAAATVEDYRRTYAIHDPDRALGSQPRDLAQRAAWRQARAAVERVHGKYRAEWDRQPTHQRLSTAQRTAGEHDRSDPVGPQAARDTSSSRHGPERAAG